MTKYISNANVFNMAQDFKSYVEKHGKVPYKLSYGGVTFYTMEMQDIMTYVLLNLTSGVKADTPKWCVEAKGDNIIENVYKEDYLDQGERVHDYIIRNGQIPNYVTTKKSKKKVNIDLFSFEVSKILVWYKNYGKLPNYCNYNYKDLIEKKTSKGKFGRSTKNGCDNRGQNNGVCCAPHMAQEIVRNLTGIVVPQFTIASVMGTSSAGTGHSGIETFFAWFNKKYGYNLKVSWKNFSEVGWSGIKKILESDNQDMGAHENYRDTWGHYTNFDKVYDNTIDVHNSLGSSCGSCYCGYTENRSKSTAERYMRGISQKSILIVTRG